MVWRSENRREQTVAQAENIKQDKETTKTEEGTHR
jgi:hypothetical protein